MGTTVNLMVTAQNAQENNIQPLQDYIESLAWWEASLTCVNPMLAGRYVVSKAINVGAIKGVHFDRDALIAKFLQCYFLTPTEAQLFIDEEDKGEHDVFEMYSYTALKAVKHKDYSGFRPLSSHIPVSINFIDAVSEDNLVIRSREPEDQCLVNATRKPKDGAMDVPIHLETSTKKINAGSFDYNVSPTNVEAQLSQIADYRQMLISNGLDEKGVLLASLGQLMSESAEVWGKGYKAATHGLTGQAKSDNLHGAMTEIGDTYYCLVWTLQELNRFFKTNYTLDDCVGLSVVSVSQK